MPASALTAIMCEIGSSDLTMGGKAAGLMRRVAEGTSGDIFRC